MTEIEAYRGRRVLILGGTGFIGRRVARLLTEAGADLHLVARNPASAARLWDRLGVRGETVEADLARAGAGEEVVRSVRPSITFNLAGYGVDPREQDESMADRLNHGLVVELVRAGEALQDANWSGQHLVHAGSAAEYGAAGGRLGEDTLPAPSGMYGKSKLAGTETIARAARLGELRAVSARLFTVYGPGERAGRLFPSLLEAARTGTELPLTTGTQRRDFTYVDDVAGGLLRLGVLPTASIGTVNLASGTLESVRGFAERAAAVLAIPAERLRFGALPGRPDEMLHDAVTVERLRELTGWLPETSIEEGVLRTLATG